MKLVDLSIKIQDRGDKVHSDSPGNAPAVEYYSHKDPVGKGGYLETFGLKDEDLIDGEGWAVEKVTIGTHSGTHMDAPYHFHSTMNHLEKEGGEPSWTIDQVPLEWCMGDAVVVDVRDKPTGYELTKNDFIEYFKKINYTLKPGDCVLLQTNATEIFGQPEYWVAGCGVGEEGTLWLTEQGVRCVGTDAWSWDIPLLHQRKLIEEGKLDPRLAWQGHKAGRLRAYVQIEKLTNLDKIPVTGAKFFAFPIPIKNASAGWIRAVAMIED